MSHLSFFFFTFSLSFSLSLSLSSFFSLSFFWVFLGGFFGLVSLLASRFSKLASLFSFPPPFSFYSLSFFRALLSLSSLFNFLPFTL